MPRLITPIIAIACLAFTIVFAISIVLADDTSPASSSEHSMTLPNLLGTWSGSFTMLTPQGHSSGATEYEFTEQTGDLLKGVNRWRTQEMSDDRDSNEPLPQGVNTVFGVIAADGLIYVVSDNDTAVRRMRLTGDHMIDFAEFAGGEQQHVVSGKLSRGNR